MVTLVETLTPKLICLIMRQKHLKKAIGVGTSKSDKADKLDIEKLETVPVDMSKLSSVLSNEFVKTNHA